MSWLKPIKIGKREILPLVEGGKGVGVSNGVTAGSWALQGGIGTFSGANADFYDENGNYAKYQYLGITRAQRHKELIEQSIKGAIAQAKIARQFCKEAFVNMNVLWEMGACEIVLEETLKKVGNIINGITCGAGMPYKLAEICSRYQVFYFPIVSSARAFKVLWKRTYKDFVDFLGAVVYEDPWIAGGHNGLSSAENPLQPQDPYARIAELRIAMNECGLAHKPIIIAGGVWHLDDWKHYIDNPEIGEVGFQFGTRPLLTQESPISDAWKSRLLELKDGDVLLNKFSPTGFYSSAVYNKFLQGLDNRSKRQVMFVNEANSDFCEPVEFGKRGRQVFVKSDDIAKVQKWIEEGFDQIMKTPDDTIIFETNDAVEEILKDQRDCMGCLSQCQFSNWCQHNGSTGKLPDPRSFCIQKSLQDIAHGESIDDNLMFAGKNVFKFGQDPFYANGFIPTVKELIERIQTGK